MEKCGLAALDVVSLRCFRCLRRLSGARRLRPAESHEGEQESLEPKERMDCHLGEEIGDDLAAHPRLQLDRPRADQPDAAVDR
jgi:hypothetical protein